MQFSVALKRLVPDFESRLLLRRAIHLPADTLELFTGRRDPLIPPRGLWFVGGDKDYAVINEEFLSYFVNLGGLLPNHRVLDVGCGLGVVAARLTKFLDHNGSYDGFDIVRAGIAWATNNITSRHPNFRFTHTDVFNKHYNPKGRLHPESFSFPYESGRFDFVFLKSVFTHMRPRSVQHYMREVSRVLKPGGCCLATAFLLNDESARLIQSGRSSLALTHDLGGQYALDPQFPETAIGFPEETFLHWLHEAGLQLRPPICYGSWCGRETVAKKPPEGFQDVVISAPRP